MGFLKDVIVLPRMDSKDVDSKEAKLFSSLVLTGKDGE
jgi:hypothetical protein